MVPDITMNNAPVYRHKGGATACIYLNNNGQWSVNRDDIDPTEADIVNGKQDQSKESVPGNSWIDNPTLKAERCHSTAELTTANPCIPPLTLSERDCVLSAVEPEMPLIDIFLNPQKNESKTQLIANEKNLSSEYFKNANMSTLFPELFQLLWYSSLPCTDAELQGVLGQADLQGVLGETMIRSCQVGGKEVNCADYFSKVPTDLGMCCALNVEKSLKESEYTQLVETMQDISGSVEKKTVAASEGINNGLSVVLDLHSNLESFGSIENDFRAFRVYIGQPTEFPAFQKRSLIIEPGHEHFIDLTSEVFSSSDGIKHLDPLKRNCYFNSEGDLEYYEEYTYINCKLECGIKEAQKLTECIPWYLPRTQDSLVCDPWMTMEFRKVLESVQAKNIMVKSD